MTPINKKRPLNEKYRGLSTYISLLIESYLYLSIINKMKKALKSAIFKRFARYGIRFARYRKNMGNAWMKQHTYIPKKCLYIVVFATPTASKSTSNKQTKNSYFRCLQSQKLCANLSTVPNRGDY